MSGGLTERLRRFSKSYFTEGGTFVFGDRTMREAADRIDELEARLISEELMHKHSQQRVQDLESDLERAVDYAELLEEKLRRERKRGTLGARLRAATEEPSR